jgi:hypothetical protein
MRRLVTTGRLAGGSAVWLVAHMIYGVSNGGVRQMVQRSDLSALRSRLKVRLRKCVVGKGHPPHAWPKPFRYVLLNCLACNDRLHLQLRLLFQRINGKPRAIAFQRQVFALLSAPTSLLVVGKLLVSAWFRGAQHAEQAGVMLSVPSSSQHMPLARCQFRLAGRMRSCNQVLHRSKPCAVAVMASGQPQSFGMFR